MRKELNLGDTRHHNNWKQEGNYQQWYTRPAQPFNSEFQEQYITRTDTGQPICFRCHRPGHLARRCKLIQNKPPEKEYGPRGGIIKQAHRNCTSIEDDTLTANVKVGNYCVKAIIDTGSKVNLVTEMLLEKIRL